VNTITVNISSKYFKSLFTMIGGLFLIYALHLSVKTKITADHLYALYDIQLEQYQDLGIDRNKTAITSQTIRDISNRFESHNLHAVIAMCVSGSFFLMLALFLRTFSVSVSNKTKNEDNC
jgi:hypothetical protein